MEMEKGDKLTRDEKAAYYATINHSLYSEINPDLFAQILDMFDKQI